MSDREESAAASAAAGGNADDVLEGLPVHPIFGPRDKSTVVTTQANSLDELITALTNSPVQWIWRGQASAAWQLVPRLQREFNRLPAPEEPGASHDYIDLENRVIGFFKERARRSLTTAPD